MFQILNITVSKCSYLSSDQSLKIWSRNSKPFWWYKQNADWISAKSNTQRGLFWWLFWQHNLRTLPDLKYLIKSILWIHYIIKSIETKKVLWTNANVQMNLSIKSYLDIISFLPGDWDINLKTLGDTAVELTGLVYMKYSLEIGLFFHNTLRESMITNAQSCLYWFILIISNLILGNSDTARCIQK